MCWQSTKHICAHCLSPCKRLSPCKKKYSQKQAERLLRVKDRQEFENSSSHVSVDNETLISSGTVPVSNYYYAIGKSMNK